MKLIREMTKVLRLGGLLHLQEWDFFVGPNPKTVENRLRESFQVAAGNEKIRLSDDARPLARWCSRFRQGLQARKASIEADTALEIMIQSRSAFGEVHQKDIWMPVGPPLSKGAPPHPVFDGSGTKTCSIDEPQNAHMNLIGEFMRENIKVGLPSFPRLVSTQAFIKGARTLVLHSGMSLEECIQLELDAIRDIQFASAPLFLRLNCVWTQKLMQ